MASSSDKDTPKPCESFATLIKTLPDQACKAMDQHISVLPNPSHEVHDYTLFEYIYYRTEGQKLVSPFEEEAAQTPPPNPTTAPLQSGSVPLPNAANRGAASLAVGGAVGANSQKPSRARNRIALSSKSASSTNSKSANSSRANVTNPAGVPAANASNLATVNTATSSVTTGPAQDVLDPKSSFERRLKAVAQEFEGKSWGKNHPLQEAVKGGHIQVLRHKLVKSWLMKKFRYARWVLYPYVALDIVTAAFVYWLQALLWNTRRLEVKFSGTTRRDVAVVYDSDLSYNSTVRAFVAAVDLVAVSDSHCATWGTEDSQSEEALDPGGASWNRSVCALYHLDQQQPQVVAMELVVIVLILLHVFVELKFFRPASLSVWDVHRVSRLALRLPLMATMLLGTSLCDLKLGCRQIIVWQLGVVAVLVCWIHVVLTLNKVPRFSGFMPVTPILLLRYFLAVVPLLLVLWAFALTFHLLFFDLLPFETVPYSLIKTVTWLLGDLGYDDTFRDGESPLAYPFLSNILFAVFILCIGGLLFNFIVGHPTEKLFELRKEDDLNRAIAHLHIHLLIDECVPAWRRKYARSHGIKTDKKRVSLYVSSDMLDSDLQNDDPGNRDYEKLVEEVAEMRQDLKTMAEALNAPKFLKQDDCADTCSTLPF